MIEMSEEKWERREKKNKVMREEREKRKENKKKNFYHSCPYASIFEIILFTHAKYFGIYNTWCECSKGVILFASMWNMFLLWYVLPSIHNNYSLSFDKDICWF